MEQKNLFIFLPISLLNEILEDDTKIDSIECSIEADSKQLESLATKLKSADRILQLDL